MSQQWEYCALVSHAAGTEDQPHGWRCRVSYFTPDGTRTRDLRRLDDAGPPDVFERALAQLGAGGWELVSIQHELVRNNMGIEGEQFLATVHTGYSFAAYATAYLKRPVVAGRPIDEPAVTIVSDEHQ